MTKASRYAAHREGRARALVALVAAERSLAVAVYRASLCTDPYERAGANESVKTLFLHRDTARTRFERADEDLHRAIWRDRFSHEEPDEELRRTVEALTDLTDRLRSAVQVARTVGRHLRDHTCSRGGPCWECSLAGMVDDALEDLDPDDLGEASGG